MYWKRLLSPFLKTSVVVYGTLSVKRSINTCTLAIASLSFINSDLWSFLIWFHICYILQFRYLTMSYSPFCTVLHRWMQKFVNCKACQCSQSWSAIFDKTHRKMELKIIYNTKQNLNRILNFIISFYKW